MTEQEFNIRYYILQLRLDKKIDSCLDTEIVVSFLLDRDEFCIRRNVNDDAQRHTVEER